MARARGQGSVYVHLPMPSVALIRGFQRDVVVQGAIRQAGLLWHSVRSGVALLLYVLSFFLVCSLFSLPFFSLEWRE